jgi:hypothetical protein
VSEVAAYAATSVERESCDPSPASTDTRVWVLRRHPRVRLRQSHAIVTIDWDAGVARTSCGLELGPDAIDDIPEGGCMPCVLCVAATPLQS